MILSALLDTVQSSFSISTFNNAVASPSECYIITSTENPRDIEGGILRVYLPTLELQVRDKCNAVGTPLGLLCSLIAPGK